MNVVCVYALSISIIFTSLLPRLVYSQQEIVLPDMGDSAGAVISREQEKKLGRRFITEFRRVAPIVDDYEVEDYVTEIGQELAALADYDGEFSFFVIDSPVINAFAVPGGFIAFHTGLILETKSEAEFASVVGHEISHVTQRHGARMMEAVSNMSTPTLAAMLVSLALMAANPQAGAAALMTSQAATQQFRIDFTRANEKEADSMGIRLMARAGYDTRKMAEFFERMERANRYSDPAYIPEYLRTHPINVNRIAEARSRSETVKPKVVKEESYKYQLVKAKLRVRAATDPMQARHWFESQLNDKTYDHEQVARYGYALALVETGDFELARGQVNLLREEYPTLIPFLLLAGGLEQKARNFEVSRTFFRKAFELYPENRAVVYGYINSLLLVNQAELAKQTLKFYGLSERRDSEYYALLAEAESQLGQAADSHHSLAEHYLILGEFPHAAEQLRLARETPGLTNYQRQKILARLEEVEKELMKLREESR